MCYYLGLKTNTSKSMQDMSTDVPIEKTAPSGSTKDVKVTPFDKRMNSN